METRPIRCRGLSRDVPQGSRCGSPGGRRDPPLPVRAAGWQARAAHRSGTRGCRSCEWHPWLRSAPTSQHRSAAHPEFQTGDGDAWLQHMTHGLFFPVCSLLDKDK